MFKVLAYKQNFDLFIKNVSLSRGQGYCIWFINMASSTGPRLHFESKGTSFLDVNGVSHAVLEINQNSKKYLLVRLKKPKAYYF